MSAPEPRLLRSTEGAAPAWREHALLIEGSQGPMVGILTQGSGRCHAAMLIVAGQPQTRSGAHRMFTELARALASQGVSTLRFDIGGWGDSPGDPRPFEASDQDIAAAARTLQALTQEGAQSSGSASSGQASGGSGKGTGGAVPLWLWGLCDGASAAALALPALAQSGVQAQGLCLVNPWVRSEASLSAAVVRTYYRQRLFERAFWARLLSGKISLRNLLLEPLRHVGTRLRRGARPQAAKQPADGPAGGTATSGPDLPGLLLAQLNGFHGELLTVLSGKDLTAGETEALLRQDKRWRKRVERRDCVLRIANADHTFSDPEHWAQVCAWLAQRISAR